MIKLVVITVKARHVIKRLEHVSMDIKLVTTALLARAHVPDVVVLDVVRILENAKVSNMRVWVGFTE